MKDFLADRTRLSSSKASVAPTASPGANFFPDLGSGGERKPGKPVSEAERLCANGQPTIEMDQTDGRIDRIIVTCGCGERITLQCAY